jgi:NAD-dependent dihydropyrimidine dehydrogenase PreA subunit
VALVHIDYELCEGSGVCEAVCPEDVLSHKNGRTEVVDPRACIDCWLCVENCCSGAIEID